MDCISKCVLALSKHNIETEINSVFSQILTFSWISTLAKILRPNLLWIWSNFANFVKVSARESYMHLKYTAQHNFESHPIPFPFKKWNDPQSPSGLPGLTNIESIRQPNLHLSFKMPQNKCEVNRNCVLCAWY